MGTVLRVPDVYFTPRPRAPEPPAARTDVVGFVGFEPRVRPAPVDAATGTPGHPFLVRVATIQLEVGDQRVVLAGDPAFALTAPVAVTPVAANTSLVYGLTVARRGREAVLVSVEGLPAPGLAAVAPQPAAMDAGVAAALGAPAPHARVVDVHLRRDAGGTLWTTIMPRRSPERCDDWRDYLLAFGPPADDGMMLGAAVRSYF